MRPRLVIHLLVMAIAMSGSLHAIAQTTSEAAQEPSVATTEPGEQAEQPTLPGEPVSSIPFAEGTLSVRAIEGEKAVFFDDAELGRDLSAQLLRLFNVGGAPVALYAMGANAESEAPCNGFLLLVWKGPDGQVRARTPPFICGTGEPAVTSEALYFFDDAIAPGQVNPMVRWTASNGFSIAADLSFAPVPGSGWDQLEARQTTIRELMANAAVYAEASKTLGDELYRVIQALQNGNALASPEPGVHVAQGCSPNQCEKLQAFGVIDAVHQGTFFAARVNDGALRVWPAIEEWPPRAREFHDRFAAGQDVFVPAPPTGQSEAAAETGRSGEAAAEPAGEPAPSQDDQRGTSAE